MSERSLGGKAYEAADLEEPGEGPSNSSSGLPSSPGGQGTLWWLLTVTFVLATGAFAIAYGAAQTTIDNKSNCPTSSPIVVPTPAPTPPTNSPVPPTPSPTPPPTPPTPSPTGAPTASPTEALGVVKFDVSDAGATAEIYYGDQILICPNSEGASVEPSMPTGGKFCIEFSMLDVGVLTFFWHRRRGQLGSGPVRGRNFGIPRSRRRVGVNLHQRHEPGSRQ